MIDRFSHVLQEGIMMEGLEEEDCAEESPEDLLFEAGEFIYFGFMTSFSSVATIYVFLLHSNN